MNNKHFKVQLMIYYLSNKNIPLFSLAIIMMLLSCASETPKSIKADQNPISFLALGDSYTIGTSVLDTEQWPVQLVDELSKQGYNVLPPRIIARNGWTTTDLKIGIQQAELKEDTIFNIVSLLIGVNNFFRKRPLDQYKKEFIDLLLKAVDFAGGRKDHVFVLSIPDYGATPFGSNQSAEVRRTTDLWNFENKNIADSLGVTYFNVTEISRLAMDDPSLIATDQLHPSGKMYKMWVDLILSDVKIMIQDQ